MRDNPISDLDYRPSYDFVRFDARLQQLERLLNPTAFAAAVTALEEQGPQPQREQARWQARLKRDAVRLVRLLARFGDLRHPVHSFTASLR